MAERRLAIVTGASTGIGRELARVEVQEGSDLLIAAGEGEAQIVSGWQNKLQAAANVLPVEALAAMHRKVAEPGSGKK